MIRREATSDLVLLSLSPIVIVAAEQGPRIAASFVVFLWWRSTGVRCCRPRRNIRPCTMRSLTSRTGCCSPNSSNGGSRNRGSRSTRGAVLLIDLDHFKELNDTLGHQAGDRLLQEIGPRLMAGVPEAGLIARVGGDEFALLLPPGSTAEQAQRAAERLLREIEQPFRFQGLTLLVRASAGIAVFPEHGRDVETLMQRADIAMYSAKARGIGHEVYSASRDGHRRRG